jgi:hypothetical protein
VLTATSLYGSVKKGQKLYQKKLQTTCGKNGGEFSALHTQNEWKKALETGTFKAIIMNECPGAKSFLENPKFDAKYKKHLYDFFYEYANDSGNVPSC